MILLLDGVCFYNGVLGMDIEAGSSIVGFSNLFLGVMGYWRLERVLIFLVSAIPLIPSNMPRPIPK